MTSIEDQSFYNCVGLTDIDIQDGVTSIGEHAFSGCTGLTEASLPDSVTEIGDSAFHSCMNLARINIPDGVTSIGGLAFYQCVPLTEINIPDGVTYIGRIPFYGTGITEITVPASVSSVGSASLQLGGGPFGGMGNLTEIVVEHGMESLPANIFYCVGAYSTALIYVPMSIVSGADTAGMTGVDSSSGIDLSRGITVRGVKGSYIVAWAKNNGLRYEEVDGEISKTDIEHAWLNVPYQYIIETGTYENIGLDFKVVDETKLPAGLELLPDGRFHVRPARPGARERSGSPCRKHGA
ncbi:MAG: leucine-rich repeat domain-containing protein [Clostridiales Family XIII bacterium]|nr:leucine-rich repeat domain-containing protein [Clostridiales Family XIII bacterium]